MNIKSTFICLIFIVTLFSFSVMESIFSYDHKNVTFQSNDDCNSIVDNISEKPIIDINLNTKNITSPSTLNKVSISGTDEKSLVIDLGCDFDISMMDLYWKNANDIHYNYTIEMMEPNSTLTKKYDYATNTTYGNFNPLGGFENSHGRYIVITLNEPYNSTIESLQQMTIYLSKDPFNIKKTDIDSWNEFDKNYPEIIHVTNLTSDNGKQSITAPSKIFEIMSGDEDDLLNPNFVLPQTPVLNIGEGHVVSFDIDYPRIEGTEVEIKVKDENGNIKEIATFNLKEIGYNDWMNSTTGIKTFYFLPYIINPPESQALKENYVYYPENETLPFTKPLEGNLTISFAPDSETSVYYKTKVNITN